jgi:protein-tyrosine-phosphatase
MWSSPWAAATPARSTLASAYLDWDLPDPAGKTVGEVRPIRDEIDRRVRTLLTELASATT